MRKLLIALSILFFIFTGCGEKTPPTQEEVLFKQADKLILAKKDDISYHGNSSEAKKIAENFSRSIEAMQKLLFTGGKENRKVTLTGDNFLTYCQLNEKSVLLLVHVPQFKRYKGKVRDSLLQMSWSVAKNSISDLKNSEKFEIAIGLKGSLMYGGSAIGIYDKEPVYENSFAVDEKNFFKYFKE